MIRSIAICLAILPLCLPQGVIQDHETVTLQGFFASFEKLQEDEEEQKKEVLDKIADFDAPSAASFLRRCASEDESPEIRVHAFRKWLSVSSVEETVLFLVAHRTRSTFTAMVECVATMQKTSSLKILIEVEGNLDEALHRKVLVNKISEYDSHEAFLYLRKKWEKCRDGSFEVDLLKYVMAMTGAEDQLFLEKLIRSKKAYARYFGIRAILMNYPEKYYTRAENILGTDRDDRVRLGALQGCSDAGMPEAARAIYMAAMQQNSVVLWDCVTALQNMPPAAVRSGIPERWYESSSNERFLCAALAFASMGDRTIVKYIKQRMKSSVSQVECVAGAYALHLLGEKDDSILELLEEDDENLLWKRLDAIQTFRIRDDAITEKVVNILVDSKSDLLRIKAAQLLGTLKPDAAAYPLLNCLDDRGKLLRIAVIRALGEIGRKESIPFLIDRLGHEKDRLLKEVCWALHRITGLNFADDINTWRKWWHRNCLSLNISRKASIKSTDFSKFEPEFKITTPPSGRYAFYGLEVTSGPRGIPNNTIFILDISGSMKGWPLEQLKKKFLSLANTIKSSCRFNVITFADTWRKWKKSLVSVPDKSRSKDRYASGTLESFILDLKARGSTNLFDAVAEALKDDAVERIIVLTDGEPNDGSISDKIEILERIRWLNRDRQVPIDTIALGIFDRPFIEDLALQNAGTFVFYYEDMTRLEDNAPVPVVVIPKKDKELPYPRYPKHCRAVMALFNGEGDRDAVITEIDKTIRNIVNQYDVREMGPLFNLRHSAENFATITSWQREMALRLFNNPGWCSRYFHNLDNADDVISSLLVLDRLYEMDPEAFKNKYEFCLAYAVVWDIYPVGYWSNRGKNKDSFYWKRSFDFYLKNERRMCIKPGELPCELNVYIISSSLTKDEMAWVLDNFKIKDLRVSNVYKSVPMTLMKSLTLSPSHDRGGDIPYTLENIKKYGGGSIEQAYFAESVFRLFGIPAIKSTDCSSYNDLGHAWVDVLHNNQSNYGKPYLSAGRYEGGCCHEGIIRDPTDFNNTIPESVFKLLGGFWSESGSIEKIEESNIYLDAANWIAADLTETHGTDEDIKKNEEIERELLVRALNINRYHINTWMYLYNMAIQRELTEQSAFFWSQKTMELVLSEYPEFTVDMLDSYIGCISNPAIITDLLSSMYQRLGKKRPDLTCRVKIIEGKSLISRMEIKDGINCFLYPLLNLTENKTIVDMALAHLRDVESQISNKQDAIDAYKNVFAATESKSRNNRLYCEARKRVAKRLYDLYQLLGNNKESVKYEQYLSRH